MVSDIKKLDEVIGVLEGNAHHLKKLNGVLDALNEAREAIEQSNVQIGALSEKQEAVVAENSQNFSSFDDKLIQLEKTLIAVGRSQNESQKEMLQLDKRLGALKEAQSNIEKAVSNQEFLTPEAFHNGSVELEDKLGGKIERLHEIIGDATRQHKNVLFLQITTIAVIVLGALANLIAHMSQLS